MADLTGPAFVTPQDVAVQPGIYRVQLDIGEAPRSLPVLVIVLVCVLVLVLEIGYLPIAGIVRMARCSARPVKSERGSLPARCLAGGVSLLNVGFVLALGVLLSTLDTTDPLLLTFGLPARYAPLLLVPFLTAVLTLVLVGLAVWVWVRRYWTVLERVLFAMVTGAAVALAGLMAYWGLLRLPV
jgi:hypothetical protein